jgi:hypothetical protein
MWLEKVVKNLHKFSKLLKILMDQKAIVFAPDRPFQPSLMFVSV